MRRTTIMLPDDLAHLLDVERERRRASIAEVVRQALDAYLRPPAAGRRYSFIGIATGDGRSAGDSPDDLRDGDYARDILPEGSRADRDR